MIYLLLKHYIHHNDNVYNNFIKGHNGNVDYLKICHIFESSYSCLNLFVLKCSIKWYILIYMYEYIFSFLHKGDESFLALIFGSLFVWCWSVYFLNFDLSSDWLSVRFFIEFSTTCPGQDSTKHVTKHP